MKRIFILGTALSTLLLFSCNQSTAKKAQDAEDHSGHEHAEEEAATTEKDCSHTHWSHDGEDDGADKWKDLCPGFSDCGGHAQSPINIETQTLTAGDTLSKLIPEYTTTNVNVINNGHTVQFNVSGENYLTIGEKKYQLLQFHYHALSEHTIDGDYSPIEVHFVHKHSDTDFAVLGVMFDEGEEYELFTKYLANFPQEKGEFVSEDIIDLNEIIPSNLNYYHYSGSLTTPPCTEVVSWYVLQNKLEASGEQVLTFSEILGENYRPVMPVNERTVYSYTE